MSFDKKRGFKCDAPGCYQDIYLRAYNRYGKLGINWDACQKIMKEKGWIARKDGDKWLNFCSQECFSRWSFQPKEVEVLATLPIVSVILADLFEYSVDTYEYFAHRSVNIRLRPNEIEFWINVGVEDLRDTMLKREPPLTLQLQLDDERVLDIRCNYRRRVDFDTGCLVLTVSSELYDRLVRCESRRCIVDRRVVKISFDEFMSSY